MNLNEIGVLYFRELRTALRERNIVINSILIPIFLYPLLLWLMFTGMAFVSGTTEGFISRVVVTGNPEYLKNFEKIFNDDEKIELNDLELTRSEAATMIRDDKLDAFFEILPPEKDTAVLEGNFCVRVTYDGSKDRSKIAQTRLNDLLDDYRSDWMHREAVTLEIPEKEWYQFDIEQKNLASDEEMGAFLMGMLLPLIFILMVGMGCFYPAIDATAGERERNTWETLMTTSVSRNSIIIAKYLYVATMGTAAGLLNLSAMAISMSSIFDSVLGEGEKDIVFDFPLSALPVMAFGAVLIALFVAAGMMIFASFARTFKEGQSMITPFYLIIILPPLLIQSPDLEFTAGLACIPVANLAMVFREALQGRFDLIMIGLSFLVALVTIVLCLRLASLILRYEDVVIGSYEGNFIGLVRERIFKKQKKEP